MTLRSRLVIFMSVSMVIIVLLMTIAGQMSLSQTQTRLEQSATAGQTLLWTKILNSQTDAMKAEMSSLTRDRSIRNALKNSTYDKLADNASTTFRRLVTSNILTSLVIYNPNLDDVFSESEQGGKAVDKTMLQKAIDTGKVAHGLTLSSTKNVLIQIAFPLHMRGKLVGIAVYARTLVDAINDYKFNANAEVAIKSANNQLQNATQNSLFGGLGVPDSANDTYQVHHFNDRVYSVATTPLISNQNNLLGFLLSATDFTESYQTQQRIQTITLVITVLLVVAVILFGAWYISKAFNPLNRIIKDLQNVAAGNLQPARKPRDKDCEEIQKLQQAMDSMTQDLRTVISSIREMSLGLEDSIVELRTLAKETNNGMQQQQEESALVATAMHQMSATVNDIASNAETAAAAAQEADNNANNGKAVIAKSLNSVQQMAQNIDHSSSSINQLEQDSKDIGSVLDVIGGIAEQTNLLALNAAIEAARAGEQGRGFAVVADEVRTLASRTQQSTEDIQNMINALQKGAKDSVSKMTICTDQVQENIVSSGESEQSFLTISSSVNSINEMNLQIASAAEEQALVSEEINKNVLNISELASTCAQNAEKTSSSSKEIKQMAKKLTELVAHFKF